jgi:hypothetical protein
MFSTTFLSLNYTHIQDINITTESLYIIHGVFNFLLKYDECGHYFVMMMMMITIYIYEDEYRDRKKHTLKLIFIVQRRKIQEGTD